MAGNILQLFDIVPSAFGRNDDLSDRVSASHKSSIEELLSAIKYKQQNTPSVVILERRHIFRRVFEERKVHCYNIYLFNICHNMNMLALQVFVTSSVMSEFAYLYYLAFDASVRSICVYLCL